MSAIDIPSVQYEGIALFAESVYTVQEIPLPFWKLWKPTKYRLVVKNLALHYLMELQATPALVTLVVDGQDELDRYKKLEHTLPTYFPNPVIASVPYGVLPIWCERNRLRFIEDFEKEKGWLNNYIFTSGQVEDVESI